MQAVIGGECALCTWKLTTPAGIQQRDGKQDVGIASNLFRYYALIARESLNNYARKLAPRAEAVAN